MFSLQSGICVIVAGLTVGSGVFFHSVAPTRAADKSSCPASYTRLSDYCFNYTTADIVLPGAPLKPLTFTDRDCRSGYRILVKSLCFNAATGDIEIANVKSRGAPKRTAN